MGGGTDAWSICFTTTSTPKGSGGAIFPLGRCCVSLLCLQNPWFTKTRHHQTKAKRLNVGGTGLGFKERPGLGSGSVRACVCACLCVCACVYVLCMCARVCGLGARLQGASGARVRLGACVCACVRVRAWCVRACVRARECVCVLGAWVERAVEAWAVTVCVCVCVCARVVCVRARVRV